MIVNKVAKFCEKEADVREFFIFLCRAQKRIAAATELGKKLIHEWKVFYYYCSKLFLGTSEILETIIKLMT